MQANTPWEMLPSRQRTRSAPRNSTRFAAQYSARGLPCERFTAVLTDRTSRITRGRGGWLDLPRGGLAPPIPCQLSWRARLWVTGGGAEHVAAAAGSPQSADALAGPQHERSGPGTDIAPLFQVHVECVPLCESFRRNSMKEGGEHGFATAVFALGRNTDGSGCDALLRASGGAHGRASQ